MHLKWEALYWTALLYIGSARGCVCMSSGRLLIGQCCFLLRVLEVVCAYLVGGSLLDILRVLEIVCACLVGGSLLDSVALYCLH